ncbi:MAG: class I SAM-dependent methyltransferase [Streptosporangiaceae bacterium]
MDLRTAWQEAADAWVRWARSPDLDDDFWQFHLPYFLDLLPPPGRLTVDVGCGEGRLGRILAAAGHQVIGCDAAFPLVEAAAEAARPGTTVVADAARLPIRDHSADLVTAFMCLHDFDDMTAAVAESARILSQDGQFAVALLHPVFTAGLTGSYADEHSYALTVDRAGQTMTYHGKHRPLTAYTTALAAAGLAIEIIREPLKAGSGKNTMPYLHLLARLPTP